MLVPASLLLLGAACAAAVAPALEDAKVKSTARLEELVSDMASQQANAAAPAPHRLGDDVVILEGEDEQRRELRRKKDVFPPCRCTSFRGGASLGDAFCAKYEGSAVICSPTISVAGALGTCADSLATRCGPSPIPGAFPLPSPVPGRMLEDEAELVQLEEQPEMFVNVSLQLSHAAAAAASLQLPSADQFARALATLTSVPKDHVKALIPLDAPGGAPSAAKPAQQQAVTVHATLGVRSAQHREAVEALLQPSKQLPLIDGKAFRILSRQVFEPSTRAPGVATP